MGEAEAVFQLEDILRKRLRSIGAEQPIVAEILPSLSTALKLEEAMVANACVEEPHSAPSPFQVRLQKVFVSKKLLLVTCPGCKMPLGF